jgi:glyoxylase-like metal-dependent hydrolase (beta-lactamase superfamily II)
MPDKKKEHSIDILLKVCLIISSRILLDAGQGVPDYIDELKTAMTKDNIQLQAILITHWHPDHIYGIKDVLKLVSKREYRNDE